MVTDFLLRLHLSTFVPLRIREIRAAGGPEQSDWERLGPLAQEIVEWGDRILYRSEQPGETGRLVGRLVDAVAMLSFCPGGIDLFGLHFESESRKGSA